MLMELGTALEMLAEGKDPLDLLTGRATEEEPPAEAPAEAALEDSGEITGYELDETDWEALLAARDGRVSSLPEETVTWLVTVGLLDQASPPQLTPFAIEWLAGED